MRSNSGTRCATLQYPRGGYTTPSHALAEPPTPQLLGGLQIGLYAFRFCMSVLRTEKNQRKFCKACEADFQPVAVCSVRRSGDTSTSSTPSSLDTLCCLCTCLCKNGCTCACVYTLETYIQREAQTDRQTEQQSERAAVVSYLLQPNRCQGRVKLEAW